MFRGSEGNFKPFFSENRAFLNDFYRKIGIFWPVHINS